MTRDMKPGDKLSLDYLNATGREIGAGRLKVDPRTGLKLVSTPWGSVLRALFPPAGWYRVTAAGTASGSYALQELVEAAGGAWANGPGTVATAYEANLNASVPAGATSGAVVWARLRRGTWRFAYGACS